jgi:hypothetical protein
MRLSMIRHARRRGCSRQASAATMPPSDSRPPQIQPPGQDAVWIGLVQGGKPVQHKEGVLREIEDDAFL